MSNHTWIPNWSPQQKVHSLSKSSSPSSSKSLHPTLSIHHLHPDYNFWQHVINNMIISANAFIYDANLQSHSWTKSQNTHRINLGNSIILDLVPIYVNISRVRSCIEKNQDSASTTIRLGLESQHEYVLKEWNEHQWSGYVTVVHACTYQTGWQWKQVPQEQQEPCQSSLRRHLSSILQ